MNPLTTGRIHTYHLPPGKLPPAVGVVVSWRFEHPDHLRHASKLLAEEADWLETEMAKGQARLFGDGAT